MVMAAVAAGLLGHWIVTTHTRCQQALFVVPPEFGLLRTQKVQVLPGEQARIVSVGKRRLARVVAHRLDLDDCYLALARLQHFLAWAVALHFGRWGVDPHQLERNAEGIAVRKAHFQHTALAMYGQRLGRGGVLVQSSHDLSSCNQTSTRSMPPALARSTYSGIQFSPRILRAISITM